MNSNCRYRFWNFQTTALSKGFKTGRRAGRPARERLETPNALESLEFWESAPEGSSTSRKSAARCFVANNPRMQLHLSATVRDRPAHHAPADADANTATCKSKETKLSC